MAPQLGRGKVRFLQVVLVSLPYEIRGCCREYESLTELYFPWPSASGTFFPPLGGLRPALLWVSSGMLGLAHIDDGWDVLLHRHPRHGPQLLCAADLLLVAVSLSRGKKKSLKNALGKLSYCGCKALVSRR